MLTIKLPFRQIVSRRFTLALVLFCVLCSPARAQSTVTNPATTACVSSIMKYYFPNMAGPTAITIVKNLTGGAPACSVAGSASATCNAAGMTAVTGSATGAQITGSPTCSFNCGACGTITIDTADGLPVELMEFSVTQVEKAKTPKE